MINNLNASRHAVGQDSETESTEHCPKYKQTKHWLMNIYGGVTWRKRLNDSCSAAVWTVAAVTVATAYFSYHNDYDP